MKTKLNAYYLNLYDKDGKMADSFTIYSTGIVAPCIAYKGTLGLHPEIKSVKNYNEPNKENSPRYFAKDLKIKPKHE